MHKLHRASLVICAEVLLAACTVHTPVSPPTPPPSSRSTPPPPALGTIVDFTLPTADANAQSIVADSAGKMWFTEFNSGKIGFIGAATSDTPTEYSGVAASAHPLAIAPGSDGRLWFTESAGSAIGAIDASGTVTEYNIGMASSHIVMGPDRRMWFTAGSSIGAMNVDGTFQLYALPASTEIPSAITVGSDNNIWYLASGAVIGKMTTSGETTLEQQFAVSSQQAATSDVCAGPDGNVWFVESNAGKIGKITTSGTVTLYTLPVGSEHPTACTKASDGNIWYAAGTVIGGVTPSGISIATYPAPQGQTFAAIAQTPVQPNWVWFTETGTFSKIGRMYI